MINQDVIGFDAHLRWMDTLAQRDDCRYFLVHDDETPIGVLDFTSLDREKKTAEWGFYLARGNRPGFGVVGFLALACYFDVWQFAELHSLVLPSNEKSYDWHRRLLFSASPESGAPETAISRLVLRREVWGDKSQKLRERLFSKYPGCRAIWRE
jgi:hypothetical protein